MLCPECGGARAASFASCPWCGTPSDAGSVPPSSDTATEEEEVAFVAPLFRFPPLTLLILLLNVFCFILLEKNGGSENQLTLLIFGAKLRAPILDGEYWRLIFANFLHIGYWHILLNSITLIQLGMVCENLYGRSRFVILYLLSGIGGFLASMAMSNTLSAGASASLFGLMGAVLTFGWRHQEGIPKGLRKHFTWYLLPWVLLMIAFGFFHGGIDNHAHIGGLCVGLFLGMILDNKVLHKAEATSGNRFVHVVMLLLVLMVARALYEGTSTILPRLEMKSAAGEKDPDGEIEVLSRFIDANAETGLYHALRGLARIEAERYAAAEEDLRHALDDDYDPPMVKNALAWSIISQDDLSRARLNEAVNLARDALRKEKDPAYKNTLGWALYLRGDIVPAISQLESALEEHLDDDGAGAILDLYMLAMAYDKRKDRDTAHARFQDAEEKRARLEESDGAVERYRSEAASLLRIALPR